MQPEKIGRYEIKAELGRGGMATVYRAYDPMFEREVALKVLPTELMHDELFRGRFEREAKIIAKLEHAAIVPVYDVGQENNQPYFVMRFMAGGSLSERMSEAPVSLEETARIVDRVATALDYAHSKGIIHRDLKPGNILFDEVGDPYISDYGIAKLAQAQQTNLTGSSIIGTPTYMSPEQAQGNEIDGRSDLYSLGVIVYEMLSTKPPYEAATPLGMVFKHVSDPIPHILDINPNLPSATEAVLEKAMAKNPDDRFRTATDFALALDALARGETPDLSRTSPATTHYRVPAARPTGTLPKQKKSSPVGWIVGGVIGILVLGAIIWGGMRFAAQSVPPTVTAAPINTPLPTDSVAQVVAPVATTAVPPTATTAPLPGVGGADKIAVTSGNNIWVMDIDGSNPLQLTTDSKPKFGLQWLSDPNKLLYARDKCVYIIDVSTKKTIKITCFDEADYFEGFRVSPDGKQVAIDVDRQVFVVPFDVTALAGAHSRNAVESMNGCLAYRAVAAKGVWWSNDGQKLAILYLLGSEESDALADTVRVIDIHSCHSADPVVLDDFPATRFIPDDYQDNLQLPSVSWDGENLFLFNTLKRNDGYGPLYTYDISLVQEDKINPIKGLCCYRDARFSPDGSYIMFAFQDITQGETNKTEVYYIPLSDLGPNKTFQPINFPPNFFADPREKPQFALRPAVPK